MEDFSKIVGAIGSAAQSAGELAGHASRLASGITIPGGIKNAARSAYNAARQLKNSTPGLGAIGTKALNAARTFKNAVRGGLSGINTTRVSNAAAKAASYIGQAAQGAGDKMASIGSSIQNSFGHYGGLQGVANRAFAPVNVGDQRNPFRTPVSGLQAAITGRTPQQSIFMPYGQQQQPTRWWGGKRTKKAFHKKGTYRLKRRR